MCKQVTVCACFIVAGKEGKRMDYSSHNCLNIIRMAGGPADHHGCPYKRSDEQTLRAMLLKLK